MSQKTSTIYPIEALNINNPKYEEKRKLDFEYFKSKSKINNKNYIKLFKNLN